VHLGHDRRHGVEGLIVPRSLWREKDVVDAHSRELVEVLDQPLQTVAPVLAQSNALAHVFSISA
jgi:hypothetical protein